MLEPYELALLFAFSFFGALFALIVAFRVAVPRLTKQMRGYALQIGNQVSKQIGESAEGLLEGVDLDAITGALGGGGAGGGEGNPLAALTGLLGSKGGGLGNILQLLGQFGGKQTGQSSSSGDQFGL